MTITFVHSVTGQRRSVDINADEATDPITHARNKLEAIFAGEGRGYTAQGWYPAVARDMQTAVNTRVGAKETR